jgi:hypothetical protein
MSVWLQEKYLRLLSPQLKQFKPIGKHVYRFRCPICGDSATKKTKTRGYVFTKSQTLLFKCHNCSIALPFAALLHRLDLGLYGEYLFEKLKEDTVHPTEAQPVVVEVPPETPGPSVTTKLVLHNTEHLSRLTTCQVRHQPVLKYVEGRGVPQSAFERLFATNTARTWVKEYVGEEKAYRVMDGENYLVLPFVLPDGTWFGCQMRMLQRKEYIVFRWSHSPLKVFGLDRLDRSKMIYMVEGPIDSLFLPNSVAFCGSDMLGGMRHLEKLGHIDTLSARTLIWDNEPRNTDICRHIETAILLGHPVVIWPRQYPKDVNDMAQQGLDVMKTIRERTFSGLQAELEFKTWKK